MIEPPHNLRAAGGLAAPMAAEELAPVEVEIIETAADDLADGMSIELADGSVEINFGGPRRDTAESDFYDNLAEILDESCLLRIGEEVMRGIQADEESRAEWLNTRAEGIKLLGLTLEAGSSSTAVGAAPVEGMSRVRHPMLLEAVIRFQANARGQLLPAQGPVKIDNDDPNSIAGDELASALQRDMNRYLTQTATEYYPDTDRALFWTGLGGCAFKKVYHHPLRKRPVSESIEAENLIVSDKAVDIDTAPRVTHRFFMRPSMVQRMQLAGAYRDCELTTPSVPQTGPVEEAKAQVTGLSPTSQNEEDREYELFECYCELFVDEIDNPGAPDGMPVPYKVTVEKESKKVLELRRNWRDGDDMFMPRRPFVKYPYLPSMGFYDIGLVQIMGNPTMAATAGWREGLDAGMFANFPGFLYAKSAARQNTSNFRVPPGGGVPIDTQGGDIRQAVMPLPYKEMGPGMMALIQNIVETGSRLGGVADISVGEGRQDAPVGTTVALLEAANAPVSAVHKRIHAAQAREIALLVDLFQEDPEAFWRGNKRPAKQWNKDLLVQALNDYDLVPSADPNTASTAQRIAKAQTVYQIAKDNPSRFDELAVYRYLFNAIGAGNADVFLKNDDGTEQQQPDLISKATLVAAEAEMLTAQTKAEDVKLKGAKLAIDAENAAKDREVKANIAVLEATTKATDTETQAETDRFMQTQELIADASFRSDRGLMP